LKLDGKFFDKFKNGFYRENNCRCSESSAILSGCRSIASLGRILPQATVICPALLESMIAAATEHCVVHLEHHMDSVRHATKAFITSLLSACRTGLLVYFEKLKNNAFQIFSGALLNCLGSKF
jgi:hypothetical protein